MRKIAVTAPKIQGRSSGPGRAIRPVAPQVGAVQAPNTFATPVAAPAQVGPAKVQSPLQMNLRAVPQKKRGV